MKNKNEIIKKFTLVGLFVVVAFSLSFSYAGAQTGGANPGAPFTLPNPLDCETFQQCLINVLNILIVFAAPLYVLMILIAAFMFIVSAGEKDKITKAKNILKYSTIGFVIVILSRALVAIVQSLVS